MDEECLHNAVKRNFFEAAMQMVKLHFINDPKRSAHAESTVRNAIQHVKNR
jgi:hypothetical protein